MTRADRFIRAYTWIGIVGGGVFLLFGVWLLWVAGSSILLVLGLLTLAGSIAARRRHQRLSRSDATSNDGHGPLAEALDGGGVDAGGGDEDSEGLA